MQDDASEFENRILENLRWRYAVKHFQRGAEVPPELWTVLEDAMILTPSSYGLQPWKFIVVQDPTIKKQLTPHSLNQPQIEDCSHLVVFLARKTMNEDWINRHVARLAEIQGSTADKLNAFKRSVLADFTRGFLKDHVAVWAARQCYIALGTLLNTSAHLGVDTCAIGGFLPDKYDEILGVDRENWSSVIVCAVGYRSLEDPRADRPKVRFQREDVIEYR